MKRELQLALEMPASWRIAVRHLLALLVLSLVAVAAPVPKEKPGERMKKLFGEVPEAKRGCDFALDGDKLVLTMASNTSELLTEKAPARAGREVKGDFEAQVTITFPMRVGKEEGSRGMVAAGLCVWADDGRYHLVGPAVKRGTDKWDLWYGWSRDVLPESTKVKSGGTSGGRSPPEWTQLFIRVKRDKHGLQWYDSTDGKTWEEGKTYVIAPPDPCWVGVCGLNATDAAWSVTFSDFLVTPVKVERK